MTEIVPMQQLFRAPGGSTGAPSSLKSGQIAYNMADGKWYCGYGDNGSGMATSIRVMAKDDFRYNIPAGTNGYVLSFDGTNPTWIDVSGLTGYTAGDGIDLTGTVISVDYTEVAAGLSLTNYALKASPTFTGTVTVPTATAADNSTKAASTAFVQTELAGYAVLASPALTGNPTAPTQTAGNSSTRLATTAFVQTAVNALIASAPGTLDTLNELAAALGNDANFSASVTTGLATKLVKTNNLSDLTDASAARGNLGLGSMATQAASAVAITGGTIAGVTITGGTF